MKLKESSLLRRTRNATQRKIGDIRMGTGHYHDSFGLGHPRRTITTTTTTSAGGGQGFLLGGTDNTRKKTGGMDCYLDISLDKNFGMIQGSLVLPLLVLLNHTPLRITKSRPPIYSHRRVTSAACIGHARQGWRMIREMQMLTLTRPRDCRNSLLAHYLSLGTGCRNHSEHTLLNNVFFSAVGTHFTGPIWTTFVQTKLLDIHRWSLRSWYYWYWGG